MLLAPIDWAIIGAYLLFSLAIGVWVARKAGEDSEQFFAAGKNMPWWLLGISMVATTFSTDTPNLVANIVRTDGVAGNWVWWAFLLTGMITVFLKKLALCHNRVFGGDYLNILDLGKPLCWEVVDRFVD